MRPTRRAALEAKKRLKENAPGDSDQAVIVTPRGVAGRGRAAAEKAEPEPEKLPARRTRQAAAQANNRKNPAGQEAAPAAGAKVEDGAWAARSAGAAEEPEPAALEGAQDMRAAKDDADEKAGPDAKKDAAEDEASTAPLPEKVIQIASILMIWRCP